MTLKQKQALLSYIGYYGGAIDGVWGQQSQQATIDFQKAYGLTADGIFGAETEKRILEVIATGEQPVADILSATAYADAEQYLQSDGCYHIPRGVDVQLSKNLWAHEIHCQGTGCCRESIISKQMVEMFQLIRDDYGEPIQIAQAGGSGYRCRIHNSEVGGAYASLHMVGNALDLHCRDKDKLLAVVNRHITDGEIGVYSWGIHVGVWNRGFVNRFTYG